MLGKWKVALESTVHACYIVSCLNILTQGSMIYDDHQTIDTLEPDAEKCN